MAEFKITFDSTVEFVRRYPIPLTSDYEVSGDLELLKKSEHAFAIRGGDAVINSELQGDYSFITIQMHVPSTVRPVRIDALVCSDDMVPWEINSTNFTAHLPRGGGLERFCDAEAQTIKFIGLITPGVRLSLQAFRVHVSIRLRAVTTLYPQLTAWGERIPVNLTYLRRTGSEHDRGADGTQYSHMMTESGVKHTYETSFELPYDADVIIGLISTYDRWLEVSVMDYIDASYRTFDEGQGTTQVIRYHSCDGETLSAARFPPWDENGYRTILITVKIYGYRCEDFSSYQILKYIKR
jgi:hypothetical protein